MRVVLRYDKIEETRKGLDLQNKRQATHDFHPHVTIKLL